MSVSRLGEPAVQSAPADAGLARDHVQAPPADADEGDLLGGGLQNCSLLCSSGETQECARAALRRSLLPLMSTTMVKGTMNQPIGH